MGDSGKSVSTPSIPNECVKYTSRIAPEAMHAHVFYKHKGISTLVNETDELPFYKDIEVFGMNETIRRVLRKLSEQIQPKWLPATFGPPDVILFTLRGVPILCLLDTTLANCAVTKPTKILAFYKGASLLIEVESMRSIIANHDKKMSTHILLRYPGVYFIILFLILGILGAFHADKIHA